MEVIRCGEVEWKCGAEMEVVSGLSARLALVSSDAAVTATAETPLRTR
jgi:hypothetical protein